MGKKICKYCPSKSNAAKKLTNKEICILGENCKEVSFKNRDIIIKQNALSTNIAYIKSGLVKIHIDGPIRKRIMKIVKGPTYICLPCNFGDKINYFSATALEPTKVCFIDLDLFKKFIYENGDFAYQIILDISKGELQNFKNCLNNAQKQNIGRIADAILFFAIEIYSSNIFTLPITRRDLADLTGITRESVSRILTDFHEEKIIEIKGRQISIINEKLLQQISNNG